MKNIRKNLSILLFCFFSLVFINQANAISNTIIQKIADKWYILSDAFASQSICTSTRNQYNVDYPNFNRTECFTNDNDSKNYYFICNKDVSCDLNNLISLTDWWNSKKDIPKDDPKNDIKNDVKDIPSQVKIDLTLTWSNWTLSGTLDRYYEQKNDFTGSITPNTLPKLNIIANNFKTNRLSLSITWSTYFSNYNSKQDKYISKLISLKNANRNNKEVVAIMNYLLIELNYVKNNIWNIDLFLDDLNDVLNSSTIWKYKIFNQSDFDLITDEVVFSWTGRYVWTTYETLNSRLLWLKKFEWEQSLTDEQIKKIKKLLLIIEIKAKDNNIKDNYLFNPIVIKLNSLKNDLNFYKNNNQMVPLINRLLAEIIAIKTDRPINSIDCQLDDQVDTKNDCSINPLK